jgi:RNA polymerase sigma-70 factor, ECF subfamily
MLKKEDSFLVKGILQGNKNVFSFIFTHYYTDLVIFANTFLKNRETSEELVQDVFLKLWENRDEIMICSSLKSYLIKSVQNRCIDTIRHDKIKHNYHSVILKHPVLFENDTEDYIFHSDLKKNLAIALNKLPEEVSRAYYMNRFEDHTYDEIAEKLQVSVRTVEVRISKALALLREELKDFLMIVLILFLMQGL